MWQYDDRHYQRNTTSYWWHDTSDFPPSIYEKTSIIIDSSDYDWSSMGDAIVVLRNWDNRVKELGCRIPNNGL